MSDTEAAAVLNRFRHRDHTDWVAVPGRSCVESDDVFDTLDPFEAVAIAEKYLRDGPPEVAARATVGGPGGRTKRC